MNISRETNWKIIFSTRRYLVESIILFVAAFGILFFATIPQFQGFLDVLAQVDDQKPVVTKLETKLANLERAETSPEFSRFELVNQALPSKKPLSELLVSLQSSAERSNATILNFELSPGTLATGSAEPTSRKAKDYDYLELQVSLEGRFVDVQNFLSSVEQFTPFTVISSISIDSSTPLNTADQTSIEKIKAELSIRTFYSTKSVQAAVEAALPEITTKDIEVLNAIATLDAITVPEQAEIEGGGNEALFGDVDKLFQ